MSRYFDIHSHLSFPEYDIDREDVINRMEQKDVSTITVGTNATTSNEALMVAHAYDRIHACIGIHPIDTTDSFFDEEVFHSMVRRGQVVAIGETGLDYYHAPVDDRERQKKLFEAHIEFALTHALPLMIHCRDAYDDMLDILESYKREQGDALRGNIHFFVGDTTIARRVLDIDFTVSVTGVITFASMYEEMVRFIPLRSLMAETDSPFTAPEPYRGQRNEPSFVEEVYRAIAHIRKQEYEDVRACITDNAHTFFNV